MQDPDVIDLSEPRCAAIWNQIVVAYNQNKLADKGVKLPYADFSVMRQPKATAKAWTLIALASRKGEPVSIKSISKWVEYWTGKSGTQQVRHLATQDGWNIGNKEDIIPGTAIKVPSGYHVLFDLERPKEGFCRRKRSAREFVLPVSFEEQKARRGGRCFTCGSKEGESVWGCETSLVVLSKGHMDPGDAATDDNRIPQCQLCNQARCNHFVHDEWGRAVAVASYIPVKRARPEVKSLILKHLIADAGEDELKVVEEMLRQRMGIR
jgi:hypothetical protein